MKLVFSQKDWEEMKISDPKKGYWTNGLYYTVIDGRPYDVSNRHFVDDYDVEDMDIDHKTYSMDDVVMMLRLMTGDWSLKVENVYIDFGANWKANSIVDDIVGNNVQFLGFDDVQKFNDNKFTLEDIKRYGQKIYEFNAKRGHAEKHFTISAYQYYLINKKIEKEAGGLALDVEYIKSLNFWDSDNILNEYAYNVLCEMCFEIDRKIDSQTFSDVIARVLINAYKEFLDEKQYVPSNNAVDEFCHSVDYWELRDKVVVSLD